MNVCLPLSLTIDCALFASMERTKFDDSVLLTTFSPASMAMGSSVAQYFPNRYSRTKTGTLAPTFTLRVSKLVVDAGQAASWYQDRVFHNLSCKRLQIDE